MVCDECQCACGLRPAQDGCAHAQPVPWDEKLNWDERFKNRTCAGANAVGARTIVALTERMTHDVGVGASEGSADDFELEHWLALAEDRRGANGLHAVPALSYLSALDY